MTFFMKRNGAHLNSTVTFDLTMRFSRDQEQKIYVQHKMEEHGQELFKWLEEGAYLYVCGDAQKMAKRCGDNAAACHWKLWPTRRR